MVDLFCTPFIDLIDRLRLEFRQQQSLFDLPQTKWYFPSTAADAPDLTVRFHGQLAGNPVGPASGPQTQMAQNLVLSWLAGSRILELKTVQVDDRLTIPRPCIDATNVGYNVEFSQELRVAESLDQYVQGAMLIEMLRAAPEEFGRPFGDVDFSEPHAQPIYDVSIGYDLAGIRSEQVCGFLQGMRDASASIERLRAQLPSRLKRLQQLDYPTALSNSVTLSTFHGCPADEIERICEFLLTEVGVHTIVKMNPPMLGQQRLEHLLYDVLGYHEVRVNPSAYTNGLQFDEAIEVCQRLTALAASRGLGFGAKFSNTLEVCNHRNFFPPEEQVMYLSGAPLHVITLTLADAFRRAVGSEMPISFSAGVDRHNFPQLVACGFTPITTCTDLLKTGGYGRLPPYLHALTAEMQKLGVSDIEAYVLAARGQAEAVDNNAVHAGLRNTSLIAAETQADPRYTEAENRKVPRRIDSHLTTFDCITCDKCIPVCPNDANFSYHVPGVAEEYRDIEVAPDGKVSYVGDVRTFRLERVEQIANFADYCNHCGNCDTFCPEYDGPYLMKPTFFGSLAAYEAGAPHDGFLLERTAEVWALRGRMQGEQYRLERATGEVTTFRFASGSVTVCWNQQRKFWLDPQTPAPAAPVRVDVGRWWTLRTLLAGITDPTRVHAANVRLLADAAEVR